MIEVSKSDIHGYGVFATQDIADGTEILKSIYIDVTQSRSSEVKKYWFAIRGGKLVLPLDRGAIINHSDHPNVRWYEKEDKIIFVAIRDIKSNEELFHNYGFCKFLKLNK